jgi:hypothetical protein
MDNKYSSKVRVARFFLKLIPIPLVALGLLERFTIPPVSLWAIGGVIVLCGISLVLAHIGEVSFSRKNDRPNSSD